MAARDDLYSAIVDARMLGNHGFEGWPDVEELMRKACELEDELRALADVLGFALVKDCRSRWCVIRKSEGVADD